ncbi:MAG: transcriptional repressor LexA [Ruminococcaceae bacterium]|nr:transcriptional repressor LexA [Oscillospiraceae bacterium]
MEKLKPKEQKIYDYIVRSMQKNGYAPSVRDICRDLGYKSTSTVHMYLNRLDLLGYITKEDGKSRAVKIVGEMPKICAVPLLGVITAGEPILAEENREGYVGYAGNIASENLFALRVKGESMIGAGILDGDIIIAEKTCYAESGEIVVALIEDEATVKRFFRENGHYRLQPENPSMQPMFFDELLILGKVIAVQRNYI